MKFQLSLTILILLFAESINAQMTFNKHNPYVSNAEIFELRKMGIDLFNRPIENIDFQKNVRNLLSLQAKHKKSRSVRVGALTTIGIGASFILASILTQEERSSTTFEFKNNYMVLGGILSTSGSLGFLFNYPKFKKSKSRLEQSFQITRGQYDVLLSN